jgi:hypothetical protein
MYTVATDVFNGEYCMLTKYYTREEEKYNHVKEGRRNRVLVLRLNDAEVAIINAMAEEENSDASKVARKRIFGDQTK